MLRRIFGRTGWEVGEIGFGAWQIGGEWGPMDDKRSIALLHYAFARGVDFVDTAPRYGDGRSETIVGRAVNGWTESRIRIATKIAPQRWPSHFDDDPVMGDLYPPDHIRASVEGSLRRLGVERLDLVQLHCWVPDGMADQRWLNVLLDMQREGKIDRVGVSIRDNRPEDGRAIAASGLVDAVQVIFNLFDHRPSDGIFPSSADAGPAIIARVPFDSGALTGSWTSDTYATWEPGSQRHRMYRGARFAEALRRVEAIREVARDYPGSFAQLALRFCLDPRVSIVIPGMTCPEEVDLNIAASAAPPLSDTLRKALEDHQWHRNFYA